MTLTKGEAKQIDRYADGLKRLKLLTSDDLVVLKAMLWRIRKPGEAELIPSYKDIMRLAGVCRNTVAQALRRFEGFGFLRRKPRWLLVAWGRVIGKGRDNLKSRRTTSLYTFVANFRQSYSYASVRPTVSRSLEILTSKVESRVASTSLEQALTRMAETMGVQLSSL